MVPSIDAFYDRLLALPDPSHPENVISDNWSSDRRKVLTLNESQSSRSM